MSDNLSEIVIAPSPRDAALVTLADSMNPRRKFAMMGTSLVEILGVEKFPEPRTHPGPQKPGLGFRVRRWNRTQAHWNKTTWVAEQTDIDRLIAHLDAAAIILKSREVKARAEASRKAKWLASQKPEVR